MKTGAQTYNLWKTPLGILSKLQVIRTLGYDAAELSGFNGTDYEGVSAESLKEEIGRLKLEICGAHVPYKVLQEKLDNVIEYHKALGIHWIAIPRPFVDSRADMDRLLGEIEEWSQRLRKEGLDLYYHCHDFEFRPFEGVTTMERILSETDVKIELDVFWAARGGADIKSFIQKNAGRILYLHLKDTDSAGDSCAVGKGHASCRDYYEMAKELGLEYVVVEDDLQRPDGITSICNSMEAIRSFEA